MEVHATLKSFPLLPARLVLTCDSVSVPLCKMREVSLCASLQSAQQGRGCFTQHSGIWKEIACKEKQLMLSSSSPSLCVDHLSAHLVQSPCRGRLWTQSFFPVKCRACAVGFQNILWSPLQVNWKCSFLPLCLFFFFSFFFSLCCEDASAAGISNPFFPCLFSLCCAYTSLPSQPGLSS